MSFYTDFLGHVVLFLFWSLTPLDSFRLSRIKRNSSGNLSPVSIPTLNTLSARQVDQLKRRQSDRDLDATPRPYVPKANSDRADWERVGQQLRNWLKS